MNAQSNSFWSKIFYNRISFTCLLLTIHFAVAAQLSNDIDDRAFIIGKVNSLADVELLKSGAANNNLQAMMLLADVYLKGTLIEKDTAAAIKLLESFIKNTDNSLNPADQRRSTVVMFRIFAICHSP